MSAHPGLIKCITEESIDNHYSGNDDRSNSRNGTRFSCPVPQKTEITSSENEKSMTPILIAAANGHWKVLESITKFYDNNPTFNRSLDSNYNPFDVRTNDTKEYVLHLILKRPFITVRKIRHFYMAFEGILYLTTRYQFIFLMYRFLTLLNNTALLVIACFLFYYRTMARKTTECTIIWSALMSFFRLHLKMKNKK